MTRAVQSTMCGIAILFALSLNATPSVASDYLPRAKDISVATHRSDAAHSHEMSAQSRRYYTRRAPSRVRIYRGYSSPGPNAVRICNAQYVQEYRASGTVIVPRMSCYWRG